MATIAAYLPAAGTMLDFGCAQGQLLARVRALFPAARLYGLDPFRSGTGYVHLHSAAQCEGLAFNVIAAFEVLEHLDEAGTEQFFRLVKNHLAPKGVCIVSVPNMLGPALLPKLLHGVLFSGSAMNYSVAEAVFAALLLKSPPRLAAGKLGTMRHKGYDWRCTRALIAAQFEIVAEKVTPFPRFWWGLNSQWFCTFRLSHPRHSG